MATLKHDLSVLFPASDSIPPDFASPPVEQREFLVDGELRTWDGPSQEVLSVVCVRRDGRLEQSRLGSYPLLDEAAAPEEEGPTPAHLRDIVERDFLEGEEPGRGERADATPGPRKVPDAHESGRGRDDGADPSRTTEDEETRRR